MAKGRKTTAAKPKEREPWLPFALLALVVLVPPFLLAPTARDVFRLPKLLASEWLGLLSLVPLAWSVRTGQSFGRPRALFALAPLVGLALLSLATSEHPEAARRALPALLVGAACLVVWSMTLPSATLERVLRLSLLPAAALSLFGMLQFHGIYRPFAFGTGVTERLSVTSLAGNAGDFGAYVVVPCLLAQWFAWRERGRRRAVLAAAALVCAYGAAVSQTLAALLALVVGSALLWFFLLPRRLVVPGLGLITGVALVTILALAPLRERVASKVLPLLEGDWNQLLTYRLDAWAAARWMLATHPWSGVGFGGFRAEYSPAKEALLDRGRTFSAFSLESTFGNAHNDFLEVGAELGWPGVLALLWGLGLLLAAARRAAPESRPAVIAGLAAMTVVALVNFPFEVALIAYPWLLFLAWIFRQETAPPSPPA